MDRPATSPPALLADLHGVLHDLSAPFVRADDLGVVRGDGVFDVAFAVRGDVRHLEDHLDRLADSAGILQLPEPDRAGFRRAAAALVTAWDWGRRPEATVRFVQTRGPAGAEAPNGWAVIEALPEETIAERNGVRVLVLDRGFEGDGIAELPWLLPGAKSLSYGVNMAAKRYARQHGADDALFVSPAGLLLEGPTSTLLLDLDGVIATPPQDGILRSITLEALRTAARSEGPEVRFQRLEREDLGRARGAWLVSSGRILAPITSVDGTALPRSPLHGRLARLLEVPGA
ncbi:MAG: aminotransferase class IV [Pseudoclavibacter sp.]|nr:aminotransferase class IV [Pseudoclavibacter sp.]